MAYGSNTGNTVDTGISSSDQDRFNSSLPDAYKGQPQQVASGAAGTEQHPSSPVVIAPADSSYTFKFDQNGYLLAGQSSVVDLSPSTDEQGNPVGVEVALSGHDTVFLNAGPDLVTDYGGHNTLVVNGGLDTIASAGHNNIIAFGDDNIVYGGRGDTINLGAYHDVVDAGYGSETINGGQNALISGFGHSSISGGVNNTVNLTGHDTLSGSIQKPFLQYNGGVETATNDTVNVAANSHVTISGKAAVNMDVTVAAHTAGDTQGPGNDTIFGGNGGLTIHTQQLGQLVSNTYNDQTQLHVLTFASGDVLNVDHVTLDFGDGAKHPV